MMARIVASAAVLAIGMSGAVASAADVVAVPGSLGPASDAGMSPRDQSIHCMAEAISYEAGSEPEAGQEAVAQVIMNRLHDPRFPKTVCGVVFQGSERRTGCQFTFTCDGSRARWLPTRSLANATRVATLALDGELSATVGAATHYHAYYVQPAWAGQLVRIGRIGAHIFYSDPRVTRVAAGAVELHDEASPPSAKPHATTLSVWGLQTALVTPVGGKIEVKQN